MRWASNHGLLAIAVLFAALGAVRADEPAAKAVEKAFAKVQASKAVDDAFAKAKAPVVKAAHTAVEEAFEKAKAAVKPRKESAPAPEWLPMPREVSVSTVNPWYISHEAPPCDECKAGCKCVDCVCESVTAKQSPPAPKVPKEERYVQVTVDRWAADIDPYRVNYLLLRERIAKGNGRVKGIVYVGVPSQQTYTLHAAVPEDGPYASAGMWKGWEPGEYAIYWDGGKVVMAKKLPAVQLAKPTITESYVTGQSCAGGSCAVSSQGILVNSTFAASPCASGNCPAPTTTRGRR